MHPDPIYSPVAAGLVLRRMKPSPAELQEAAIGPGCQSYRVLTGQEPKKHFGLTRVDPARPCPTIQKSTPQSSTTGLIHPTVVRHLAISEIKALSSFPAEFTFRGRFVEKWARVGNAVPPLLMKAIAAELRDVIAGLRQKGDPEAC